MPDVHATIDALAEINVAPELGGITREVYTPAYAESVALTDAFMRERGLETRVDAAGNLIGRLPGTDPSLPRVLTGSHIDTTLNAGAYDGVVGVLGGAEALGRIGGGPRPRRTLEVIAWAGEEPRFGMGCIGSQLMSGALTRPDLARYQDRDGITIAAALRAYGLDPDRAPAARIDPAEVHALLELHVEQGGRLEAEHAALGIVDQIAAAINVRVILGGRAVHSGSTPMNLRHDALLGAAELGLALERLSVESASPHTVGTIGMLAVEPGAVNVVPGEARMMIDLRDTDLAVRTAVLEGLRAEIDAICRRRGLTSELQFIQDNRPTRCAELVVEAVRAGCELTGAPTIAMPSGAYHDCMSFADQFPIGMLFVPSRGGLSHSPDEYTAPAEIDLGIDALTEALRRLAA